jgi:DNA-binding ferritin-like protein (Dps family)
MEQKNNPPIPRKMDEINSRIEKLERESKQNYKKIEEKIDKKTKSVGKRMKILNMS